MKQKPRKSGEKVLNNRMLIGTFLVGVAMAIGTLWAFKSVADLTEARTLTFTALILLQLTLVFPLRSYRHSLLKQNSLENKYLLGAIAASVLLQLAIIYVAPFQLLFKTTGLHFIELAELLVLIPFVILFVELDKFVCRRMNKPEAI